LNTAVRQPVILEIKKQQRAVLFRLSVYSII
jgi:hypothetical protein